MQTLLKAIKEADSTEIDCSWCVLRDIRLGIKRKLLCWALIFGLEEETILAEAPKDNDGRILDKETRTIFHESLLKESKKQTFDNKNTQ